MVTFKLRALPRELVQSVVRPSRVRTAHAAQVTHRVPHLRSLSTAAPPAFSFTVAASFHGKPAEPDEPSERRRRRPAKISQGFAPTSPIALWRDQSLKDAPWGAGHDWFMVEPQKDGNGVVVGIADGVGGWEDSGVDPSHFSQAFMYYCKEAVKGGMRGGPEDIMEMGFKGVTGEKDVVAGSSTACVVTLDAASGLLQAANLGDSTFLLLRDEKVIHAQPAQCHYFNAPRQLSKLPKGSSTDGAFTDLPSHAELFQATLKHNDILLVATDGFSDNVWSGELEKLVTLVSSTRDEITTETLVHNLATASCNYARMCSFKENKESPFEAEARTHGLDYKGGKVDDVCVIAVLVQKV